MHSSHPLIYSSKSLHNHNQACKNDSEKNSAQKCKTAKPLNDFRSRYKREAAWRQPCRDIKNQVKRAANWSKAAAELTPEKAHQRQFQPESDNENAISRIQPTEAQEQATRETTSASISDTAFLPLTHPQSRPDLSATSPIRPNLTTVSCSPIDRELQSKIPTASSSADLRTPANTYAPIPMRAFNPLVTPTDPGLLDGPAISVADTEHFRNFNDQDQSQPMQTCLQCQKPGFNMWLNSRGICAHCQKPNDISDGTARDVEEPAKDLEPDDLNHGTIGQHGPDVALPSTEDDMVLNPDDVSSHKTQASG